MNISKTAHAASAARLSRSVLVITLAGALSVPLQSAAQRVGGFNNGVRDGSADSIKGEPEQVFRSGFQSCTPVFATGSIGEWDGTFGMSWPAYNNALRIFSTANQYVALRFNAAQNATQSGRVLTTEFPGGGSGVGVISISREPGCFDPAFLGENCLGPIQSGPTLDWTNDFSLPGCRLEPGRSYYLNVTFGGTVPGNGTPSCTSGNCGVDLRNVTQ